MARRKATKRVGTAYYRAISNIERMMEELGFDQKAVALGSGIAESVFSQKKRGGLSHFYEDEFDDIAEFMRRHTDRPLIGFPHLSWDMMESCDRKVGGWVKRAH